MPVYEGTREIDVPAPPEACFAVLTDYERLPEWQRMVRRCEILSRDEQGRAAEVEYEIDWGSGQKQTVFKTDSINVREQIA